MLSTLHTVSLIIITTRKGCISSPLLGGQENEGGEVRTCPKPVSGGRGLTNSALTTLHADWIVNLSLLIPKRSVRGMWRASQSALGVMTLHLD